MLNKKHDKITIFYFIINFFFSYAQVGVNTQLPQATLDVVGSPTNNTILDGIIAPRISGDLLRAKNYTSAQTGTLVYVTAADSALSGQTLDVTSTGYYCYNGDVLVNKWVKMLSGYTQKIRSLSSGTIAADDYTLLVTGNISLPAANAANTGKVYNLINDTTSTVTVSGTFRINGGNFTNYSLNNTDSGRGIIIQSTGSAWVLLSRY